MRLSDAVCPFRLFKLAHGHPAVHLHVRLPAAARQVSRQPQERSFWHFLEGCARGRTFEPLGSWLLPHHGSQNPCFLTAVLKPPAPAPVKRTVTSNWHMPMLSVS